MKADRLPYPVYATDSPDYSCILFNADVEAENDALFIDVIGEFRLMDETILNMIESGAAYYGLFIECPDTDHKCVKRCARKFKEKIIKAEVADHITVTPVILASRDVVDYRHESLTEDYQGVPISIPEGGIIAFDDEAEITLSRGTPQTVESICKFRMSSKGLYYDVRGDSIEIFLPEEVFASYKKMNRQERLILTSIYFPPVLTQIVQDVYYDNIFDRNELSGKHWYMAIENAVASYNIDFEKECAYTASMGMIEGLLRDGAETVTLFNKEVPE